MRSEIAPCQKLHMDFVRDLSMCAFMDDADDLALALLSVVGSLVEEAASIAPLAVLDTAQLVESIDQLLLCVRDAEQMLEAARVAAGRSSTTA